MPLALLRTGRHVNMYVDDSGLIKKIPVNERASALAVRQNERGRKPATVASSF